MTKYIIAAHTLVVFRLYILAMCVSCLAHVVRSTDITVLQIFLYAVSFSLFAIIDVADQIGCSKTVCALPEECLGPCNRSEFCVFIGYQANHICLTNFMRLQTKQVESKKSYLASAANHWPFQTKQRHHTMCGQQTNPERKLNSQSQGNTREFNFGKTPDHNFTRANPEAVSEFWPPHCVAQLAGSVAQLIQGKKQSVCVA